VLVLEHSTAQHSTAQHSTPQLDDHETKSPIMSRTVENFRGEIWSLFALGVLFTLSRMVARLRIVGFRQLKPDDYLVCLSLLFFSGEAAIADYGGSIFYGAERRGVRGGLGPEALAQLPAGDPRLQLWLEGQRLHFSSWFMYTSSLWTLKLSLLFLYLRLTVGLAGSYRRRIFIGFGMLAATYIAVFIVPFAACRPFSQYWTARPFPPLQCRPAVAPPIVVLTYVTNVVTDLYLISIPLPMFWETTMKSWKKYSLALLFSGGAIIVVFATIRLVLIVTDPVNGAPVSGTWSVRETFVAIVVTNAPMAFTLVRGLLGPAFRSTDRGNSSPPQVGQYKGKQLSSGDGGETGRSGVPLATIGSGTKNSRRDRGRSSHAMMTNQIFSESEERIVYGDDSPALSGRTLQPLESQD
jgi:hypothetical protein